MSAPTEATPIPDQAPAVPPPVSRKPTASEKADIALARLDDLERKLDDGFSVHPDLAQSGTASPLTAEQSEALDKVPGLDTDLNALVDSFNAMSGKVDSVGNVAAGVATKLETLLSDGLPAQGGQDSAARDSINSVLTMVRELSTRVDSLGSGEAPTTLELHGALAKLHERLRAVEGRPALAAGSSAAAAPTAGLARPAVLRLMRKVVEIGKGGQAPASAGGFKFRGIEAVMDAIGSAMRHEDVGLIMETKVLDREVDRTEGGGRMWTSVILTMRYTFVHPEDGSEHSFEMVGEGRDMGDKAASKAASMAAKYGLCQALMIPFTNMADSDAEDPASEQAAAQQAASAVTRLAGTVGVPEAPPVDAASAEESPDDRTPEEKAAAIVAALGKLNSVSLLEARARFDRIASAATAQGLTGLISDGSNIAYHLQVNRILLERAEAASAPSHG